MAHDKDLWVQASIPDNIDSPAGVFSRITSRELAAVLTALWRVHSAVNVRTSRAIKILNRFRVIMDADKPSATGSGFLWVDTANDSLWYDDPAAGTPTWVSLGGGAGESIEINTSSFDKNLSSADDTIQKALDTIDDLEIINYIHMDGGRADDNIFSYDGGRADSEYLEMDVFDCGGA